MNSSRNSNSLSQPGSRIRALATRLQGSALIWSWLFNGLRLASGLVVLPLLLHQLSRTELGIYYLLLNLGTIAFLADFGFSLSVERAVAYAMGGAANLRATGMELSTGGEPNRVLLREVVRSAQQLYRGLSAAAAVALALGGTYLVSKATRDLPALAAVSFVPNTVLAWALQWMATSLEIYSFYWVAVLRGMNRITTSAQWLSLAYGLKVALSIGLLFLGAGLLSVPLAGLVAGVVLRWGASREVRRILPDLGVSGAGEVRRVVSALWPNSWRLGLQLASSYAMTYGLAWVCMSVSWLGAAMYAEYSLSLQVMNIAVGVAGVWTSTKWPLVAQLRTKDDRLGIRRVLAPRFRWQVVTLVLLASLAILLGPALLEWKGSDKRMLPALWLVVLAINALGESNFSFWTTLISTENRIPSVGPLVATQVTVLGTVVVLVLALGWGVEAFVVTPLLLGAIFNYWWWARQGSRILRTTFWRFFFGKAPLAHG
ncbi:MAG: hypothetical protein IT581_16575 [Verrucomicrobiales bacterium]|nr:hypothetical protein [Verrucomicrobiales bacterium]